MRIPTRFGRSTSPRAVPTTRRPGSGTTASSIRWTLGASSPSGSPRPSTRPSRRRPSASFACDAALQPEAEATAARARRVRGLSPLVRRAAPRRQDRQARAAPASLPAGARGRRTDAAGVPATSRQAREGGIEETMQTIELSDEEMRLLYAALHSYLDDFGHEEADVLRRIKALIAKLQEPTA